MKTDFSNPNTLNMLKGKFFFWAYLACLAGNLFAAHPFFPVIDLLSQPVTSLSRVSVEAAFWTSAGGGRAGGRAREGRLQGGGAGVGRTRPRDRWKAAVGRSNRQRAA
jgi:hypothetical protein